MIFQTDVIKNHDKEGKPYYVGIVRNTLPEPNPRGLFTKWKEVSRGWDREEVVERVGAYVEKEN